MIRLLLLLTLISCQNIVDGTHTGVEEIGKFGEAMGRIPRIVANKLLGTDKTEDELDDLDRKIEKVKSDLLKKYNNVYKLYNEVKDKHGDVEGDIKELEDDLKELNNKVSDLEDDLEDLEDLEGDLDKVLDKLKCASKANGLKSVKECLE